MQIIDDASSADSKFNSVAVKKINSLANSQNNSLLDLSMATVSEGSKKSSENRDQASDESDTEVRKVDRQAARTAKQQQPGSF